MNNIGIEKIYFNLIREVQQKYKKSKENEEKLTQNQSKTVPLKPKIIEFNGNTKDWLFQKFETIINNDKEIEYPKKLSISWENSTNASEIKKEVTNSIFLLKEGIDFNIFNNIINMNFILKGDSKCWIFLRCDNENDFNEKTIVFLFTKIKCSEHVFVSIGTYIKNENENSYNLYFFQTQQLIKTFDKKNDDSLPFYTNSIDLCNIKLDIIDEGREFIKIKCYLNEGKDANELIASFCRPVAFSEDGEGKLFKMMLAGSGEKCQIVNFQYKFVDKKIQINGNKDDSDCNLF